MALPTADIAPTGRARCQLCSEPIPKQSVRVAIPHDSRDLSIAGGFLHPGCAGGWAARPLGDTVSWPPGIDDLLERIAENTRLPDLPPELRVSPEAIVVAPPFEGLSSEQIAAIAKQLRRVSYPFEAAPIFEKSGVDAGKLAWHLARHGLVPPMHQATAEPLGSSARTAAADDVFAVIPSLGRARVGFELLDHWGTHADAIVQRAHDLDPARLAPLLDNADPTLRLGILLVQGRAGVALTDADRALVLDALAAQQAGSHQDARRVELAKLFGTEAQWAQALARHVGSAKFQFIAGVRPGLLLLSVSEVAAVLLEASLSTQPTRQDADLLQLLEERNDDPLALADAARLHERSGSRDFLLAWAMMRLGARRRPIPEGLERDLCWGALDWGDAEAMAPWGKSAVLGRLYRGALEALPRDRAVSLMKHIPWPYESSIAAILAVHFDEEVLQDLLRRETGERHAMAALAACGQSVLPALSKARREATDPKIRASFELGMRSALGYIGLTGGGFEESYDELLTTSPEASSWSDPDRETFLGMLRGMTEPRRRKALDRVLAAPRYVERGFYGVQALEEPANRAQTAKALVERFSTIQDRGLLQRGLVALKEGGLAPFREAILEGKPDPRLLEELAHVFGSSEVGKLQKKAGVKKESRLARLLRLAKEAQATENWIERVYLIELPGKEAPKPRKGSWSMRGGAGPAAVKPASGHRHILTVDLEEVPELAERFPEVRALSLWANDAGGEWEQAELHRVPAGGEAPPKGEPLSIVPLDLPSGVFHEEQAYAVPALKELRELLSGRPGLLLGEPLLIQEAGELDPFSLIMQLNESLTGGSLGDSGALYIFEDTIFCQSN